MIDLRNFYIGLAILGGLGSIGVFTGIHFDKTLRPEAASELFWLGAVYAVTAAAGILMACPEHRQVDNPRSDAEGLIGKIRHEYKAAAPALQIIGLVTLLVILVTLVGVMSSLAGDMWFAG